MSGVAPVTPKLSFLSASGVPLSGGSLTVYLAGSTTLTTTWQDRALETENTNPIVLDSRGECTMWTDPALTYKWVLKNAADVPQYTVDNVSGAGGVAPTVAVFNVERFSGTGAETVFTLASAPSGENNTDVYVAGVYQQKNTYSVDGTALTFAVAPALGTNNIEVKTIDVTDYTAVAVDLAAQFAQTQSLFNRLYLGAF